MATTTEVTSLYQELLGRTPDQGGLDYWQKYDAATVRGGILNSSEYLAKINSASQVPSYINDVQNTKAYQLMAESSPFADTLNKTSEGIKQEVSDALTPTLEKPTPINFSDMYDQMRVDFNLDSIENQINDLSTQIDRETLNITKGRNLERGKPVALNVVEGRISERDRQQAEKIQDLSLVRDSAVRYLNSANSVINLRMELKKEDYNVARQAYQDEFQENLAVYNAFKTEEARVDDIKLKIYNEERAFASSQVQMYVNLISNGQISFNQLSPSQKSQISQLETMAGLPVGFTSSVKMTPGADIKSITTREAGGRKYVDIVRVGENGQLKVETQFAGNVDVPSYMYNSSNSKETEAKSQADAATKAYDALINSSKSALRQGASWGEVWNSIKAKYPGVSNKDIDTALGVPASWSGPGYEWWDKNTNY